MWWDPGLSQNLCPRARGPSAELPLHHWTVRTVPGADELNSTDEMFLFRIQEAWTSEPALHPEALEMLWGK